MLFKYVAVLMALGSLTQVQAKAVFAHVIVGNNAAYTTATWTDDITKAKAVGIDAFALNIASQDPNTATQLVNAAAAANQVGGFGLFLSFDYLAQGAWSTANVINTLNNFVSTAGAAHYRFNNKPLVSTFEGVPNAGDWALIKAATNCYFIPDWTSAGPSGIPQTNIDGAFSWDTWPDGPTLKTAASDQAWQKALGAKSYMMGVSPWFYTALPQFGKNWGWRSDGLWTNRWTEVMQIQPHFVEIISWNDYGESHYIGPIRTPGIVTGASRYVANNPHDAWRNLLPYYITPYKTGVAPAVTKALIAYYHKLNPNFSCNDDGTAGNQRGATPYTIEQVSLDQLSVDVVIASAATVTVQIGTNAVRTFTAPNAGVNHIIVPFNGQTAAVVVKLSRNGTPLATASGTIITNNCVNGLMNFNAIVVGAP